MKNFEKKVSEDKVFYLANGQTISSLKELYTSVQQMPADVFFHHVNSDRNDFSNWVRDVMEEKALAAKIAKAATPVMLKEVLSSMEVAKAAPKKVVASKTAPAKTAVAPKTPAARKTTKK